MIFIVVMERAVKKMMVARVVFRPKRCEKGIVSGKV